MKEEKLALVHNILNIQMLDINILKRAVTEKLFCNDTFSFIIKNLKDKNHNFIPLNDFEQLIKKYPKKKKCWCLSSLSFFDCHFARNRQNLDKKSTQNKIKKILNKKECLHKNISICSNDIIKAHSISKKGALTSISENNHVYGLKFDFNGFIFKKIGINDASTFYGFCKKHDELLFSSFEKHDFNKTKKQLFDLCYRAICQEHYTMLRVVDILREIKSNKDINYNFEDQIEFQITINSQIKFYELGIKYSNHYKNKLEKKYYLLNHEDNLQHYIFELSDNYPKFQSSTCFNLEYDLEGNQLQDLNKAEIQSKNIFMNCISLQQKGYFIISWFKENSDYGKQIINSIISKPLLIEDKLFSLTFLYIHNTFVSPKWFESLTESQKIDLKNLRDFWAEKENFSTSMIQDNMGSIKIDNHYFFK